MDKASASIIIKPHFSERLLRSALSGHWGEIERLLARINGQVHFPTYTAIGTFEGKVLVVKGTWTKTHLMDARARMHDGSCVIISADQAYESHGMVASDDLPWEAAQKECFGAPGELMCEGDVRTISTGMRSVSFAGTPSTDRDHLAPWLPRLEAQIARKNGSGSPMLSSALFHGTSSIDDLAAQDRDARGDIEQKLKVSTDWTTAAQETVCHGYPIGSLARGALARSAAIGFVCNRIERFAKLCDPLASYIAQSVFNTVVMQRYRALAGLRMRETGKRNRGEIPCWRDIVTHFKDQEGALFTYYQPASRPYPAFTSLSRFIHKDGIVLRIPSDNPHSLAAGVLVCLVIRKGDIIDNWLYPRVGPDLKFHDSLVALLHLPEANELPPKFCLSPADYTLEDYRKAGDGTDTLCAAALDTLTQLVSVESDSADREASEAPASAAPASIPQAPSSPSDEIELAFDKIPETERRFFERRRFVPRSGFADHRAIYLYQHGILRDLTYGNEKGYKIQDLFAAYRQVRQCLRTDNSIWLLDRGLKDVLDRSDLAPGWDLWNQPWPLEAMHMVLPLDQDKHGTIVTISRDEGQSYGDALEWPNREFLTAPKAEACQPNIAVTILREGKAETSLLFLDKDSHGIAYVTELKEGMSLESYQVLLLACKVLAWMVYSPKSHQPAEKLRKGREDHAGKKRQDELWSAPIIKLPTDLEGRKLAASVEKFKRDESRGMREHWRRGHLRNQRHGPAYSLIKVIFIPPCRVGAESEAA